MNPRLLVIALLLASTRVFAQTPAAPAAPARAEVVLPPPAVPDAARFNKFFAPHRTQTAAISPDGRYLAFSLRDSGKLYVLTVEIDHPEKPLAKVLVADDETSTGMMVAFQAEPTPAQIRWMRWATPTRVVVETNRTTDLPGENWRSLTGVVLAFDFDGQNAQVLVSPKDLPEPETVAVGAAQLDRFALRRNNREFEQRINSVDRPMSSDTSGGKFGNETLTVDTTLNPPPPADVVIPSVRPGTEPSSLRVVRVVPEKPGLVEVLATGPGRSNASHSIRLFTVDVQSREFKLVGSDSASDERDFLLDQQGAMRISIPNAVPPGFPHHYEYLSRSALAMRSKLATVFPQLGADAFSISPDNYFAERELPLGFDRDGKTLYYASNRGRDTYAVYSYDVEAKRAGKVAFENPNFDLIAAPQDAFPPDTLVFDPYTAELAGIRYDHLMRTAAWLRPELHETQAVLERRLPGLAIDIVDWDRSARRFIVATQGPANAGAFYVFDREKAKLMEFARRAPWFDESHTFATLPFSFQRPDGSTITGLITVPTTPRIKPFPMVLVCPDVPWQRVQSDFRPEIHALTDMGFAVVQLNARGAWGHGRRLRAALTAGYDTAQVEDLVMSITELEKRFNVNRDRVALFGRSHGGFVALRALQEHPDKFRCAIAIDAPVNLKNWLEESLWTEGSAFEQLVRNAFGDAAHLAATPLVKHPDLLRRPLLLMSYPGPENGARLGTYLEARSFAAAAERTAEVTFRDLPSDYRRGLPAARAAAFAQVEEFLNLHIYSYRATPGEVRQVEMLRK